MNRKIDFAADDFLVDFFLENAFAVNAKEWFAVFFVADGMDNFEFEVYEGFFAFIWLTCGWFVQALVCCLLCRRLASLWFPRFCCCREGFVECVYGEFEVVWAVCV